MLLAIPFPAIDPVLIEIGPVAIRWYALAYIIGLVGGWALARRLVSAPALWGAARPPAKETLDDLLVHAAFGVILGGRLGYVAFYNPEHFLAHPLEIFMLWQGGMSFHGGFLGVIVAMWFFARTRRMNWLAITDFIAPLVPLGLGAGRIGNFINAELWGRPTDVAWGMVFPNVDAAVRHPSQLYEFALEGVVLFLILWFYSAKPRPRGAVSALFLIGYGTFRFLVEYTREPDSFLGLLAMGFSMGQWLSLPMVVVGLALLAWSYRRPERSATV